MYVFVPLLGDFFQYHGMHGRLSWQARVFVPFLGDFFQCTSLARGRRGRKFSSPFSGTFFQFASPCHGFRDGSPVFVPFLGDLFSIWRQAERGSHHDYGSFRPLSWGLSFNSKMAFVKAILHGWFSSPLLGTFFQSPHYHLIIFGYDLFSSPFSGTFFQLCEGVVRHPARACFRPLSWGLSFNNTEEQMDTWEVKFSSPFLGTFFQ